jgi:DNA invertase Pin-like site-specific DNA recombinase
LFEAFLLRNHFLPCKKKKTSLFIDFFAVFHPEKTEFGGRKMMRGREKGRERERERVRKRERESERKRERARERKREFFSLSNTSVRRMNKREIFSFFSLFHSSFFSFLLLLSFI